MPDSDALHDRLPNLVIAGVTKGGTTSLFAYLGQHPQICASDVKEIEYFSRARRDAELPPLDDYARHFAHWRGQPYRLEASPSYYYGGQAVIDAVRRTLPAPRLIISLRDPADRLWSGFTYLKSLGRIPKGQEFAPWLAQCEAEHRTVAEQEPWRQTLLSVGFYERFLPGWLDAFGEDLLVTFAENLFADPRKTMRTICNWLSIDPAVADEIDYRAQNSTIAPRSRTLARAAYMGKDFAERTLPRQRELRARIGGIYRTVNRSGHREKLPDNMRERLRLMYRPANARLAGELRRRGYFDLPQWLADA